MCTSTAKTILVCLLLLAGCGSNGSGTLDSGSTEVTDLSRHDVLTDAAFADSDSKPDTVGPVPAVRCGVGRVTLTPSFEPYTDANSNNSFDEGEPYDDTNKNGKYDSLYIGGFGLRTPTGVHDDLYATTVAIEVHGDLFLLTSLDLLGLSMKRVNAVKSAVAAGIPAGLRFSADRMIVASTHTHQGPDTMGVFGPNSGPGWDEQYLTLVVDKAVESVFAAVEDLRPATLWLASTSDTLDLIRDIDPPEIFDPYVGVIQAKDLQGGVIATLLSVANHPEAAWGDNTEVSSDYVHYLRGALESDLGGHVLFFAGALGLMQTPKEIGVEGFDRAEKIGNSYADRVKVALTQAEPLDVATESSRYEYFKVRVVLENPELYIGVLGNIAEGYSDYLEREEEGPCSFMGCLDLPILAWRLGDLLTLVTFPGELTPELIVGGIVSPPNYSGEFPDAPAEPHLAAHLMTKYRFIVGLADSATGYYYPKMTFDPNETYGQHHGAGPNAAMSLMTAAVEALDSLNAQF